MQPINEAIRLALDDSTTFDTAVQEAAAPEPATLPMLLFAGLAASVAGLWGDGGDVKAAVTDGSRTFTLPTER